MGFGNKDRRLARAAKGRVLVVAAGLVLSLAAGPTLAQTGLAPSGPVYLKKDALRGERPDGVGFDGQAQWLTDMNADGRADYVYNRDGGGDYFVMLAAPDGRFGQAMFWGSRQSGSKVGWSGKGQWLADVNGDGRPDFVYNIDGTPKYHVLISREDGAGFKPDAFWGQRNAGSEVARHGQAAWFADVNGDGRADYVYNRDGGGEFWALLASSVADQAVTDRQWGVLADKHRVADGGTSVWLADVDGDHRADVLYSRAGGPEYGVLLSTGFGFAADRLWGNRNRQNNIGFGGRGQWTADVNGDGRADLVYNRDARREQWVMLSKGATAQPDSYWGSRDSNNDVAQDGAAQWLADVNGDGKADYVYNRRNTGEYWATLANPAGTGFEPDHILGARNSANGVGFGGSAQWLVDLDGDGRLDVAYNRNETRQTWGLVTADRNPSAFTMVFVSDGQPFWSQQSKRQNADGNRATISAMNAIAQTSDAAGHTAGQWPSTVSGGPIAEPAAVIVNGDLTSFWNGDQPAFYQDLYQNQLKWLIYPGLGNHDYKNNRGDCGLPKDDRCAMGAVAYMERTVWGDDIFYSNHALTSSYDTGSLAYSFDVGNIHFVQLQLNPAYEASLSCIARAWQRCDPPTTRKITQSYDWLTIDLAVATARNKQIVINMHEYADTGDARFEAAIAGRSVVAVVSAHWHQSYGFVGYVPGTSIPHFRTGGLVNTDDEKSWVKKFLLVRFDATRMDVGVIDYACGDGTPRFFSNGPDAYLQTFTYTDSRAPGTSGQRSIPRGTATTCP